MVNRFQFTFADITVSDWSQYSVTLDCISGSYPTGYNTNSYINLFFLSGGDVFMSDGTLGLNTNRIIASYTTGVPFDVSGWVNMASGTYINVDGAEGFQSSLMTKYGGSGSFGQLKIINSGSGTFASNIFLIGDQINYSFSVQPIPANGASTGSLISNYNGMIFDLNLYFYQSNQPILTFSGSQNISGVNSQVNNSYVMFDNDADFRTIGGNALAIVGTLQGQVTVPFSYFKFINDVVTLSITSQNSGQTTFGGQFNGIWENNQFTYQDFPSVLTLNYIVSNNDTFGNPNPSTFFLDINMGSGLPYSYISGFNLTSNGEYLYTPTVLFTGYYGITGIQEAFAPLLFSSGCSGNLPISFLPSNGSGSAASGLLLTTAVQLQNLYFAGIQTYYIVNGYQILNQGSGYTLAPKAIVNTGFYGSTCYDVPAKYPNVFPVFAAFDTSGTLLPLASYLTGTAMTTTGLVSEGTIPGLIVTGIDISNIGSGYTPSQFPFISFIRQPGDTLTKNASGNFVLTTSGYSNLNQYTTVQQLIQNQDFTTVTQFSGTSIQLDPTQQMVTYQIAVSGCPFTQPSSGGYIVFSTDGVNYNISEDPIVFARTFSTDPLSLKKNNINFTGVYTQVVPLGSDLSFLLTQNQLDMLYTSYSSSQTLDLGDLNF
jgi:hypothetical protein